MALRQPATARLKGSAGLSRTGVLGLLLVAIASYSAQRHVDRALRQLDPEAALIELRHDRPLELVAFVEESDPEREADVAEDLGILRPDDHRARAHDGRDVAVHEGVAGEVGDPHHLVDDLAPLIVA